MSSTPIACPLTMRGITISDRTESMMLMYRGSSRTSGTRTARRRGRTRNPLSHWDHPIFAGFLAVADGEAVVETVHRFIDQQNAEDFVVDQPLHERRGLPQDLVEIERGID